MDRADDEATVGGRRISLAKIETVLAQHPGVHQAAVVSWDVDPGDEKLSAYIVPDADYLHHTLADDDEDARRLDQWRQVYDWFGTGKDENDKDIGFNTSIWNSSYTRHAIPAEEMREWVNLTVDQVLALKPIEALEIGCGTGPLLLRIAPQCRRYVGTDFSAGSLRSAKRHMEELEGGWEGVTLLEQAADRVGELGSAAFDTVIMNSVTQCFPSAKYLKKVVKHIVDVTKPGGAVFIGDVRNLALLAAFAVSVELYLAPAESRVAELRQRVRKRLQHERELVISPSFFSGLQQHHLQISRVEIRPKLGGSDNELMNFRYDVVLRVGSGASTTVEPPWLDGSGRPLTLRAVRELLEQERREIFGITRVGNARVEKDVAALALLSESGGPVTVGELREELRGIRVGITPYELRSLARECGYAVDMSWASAHADGSYDVVFRRMAREDRPGAFAVGWPTPSRVDESIAVSDPSRLARHRRLIQQLREYVRAKLADHERPADFVVTNGLPLTVAGRPDRRRLRAPNRIFQEHA